MEAYLHPLFLHIREKSSFQRGRLVCSSGPCLALTCGLGPTSRCPKVRGQYRRWVVSIFHVQFICPKIVLNESPYETLGSCPGLNFIAEVIIHHQPCGLPCRPVKKNCVLHIWFCKTSSRVLRSVIFKHVFFKIKMCLNYRCDAYHLYGYSLLPDCMKCMLEIMELSFIFSKEICSF